MPVPVAPREMMRKMSSSVGSWPDAVVRNLNCAATKSRGGGTRNGAPYPAPSPFSPWQCAQLTSYSSLPRASTASVAAGCAGTSMSRNPGTAPVLPAAAFCRWHALTAIASASADVARTRALTKFLFLICHLSLFRLPAFQPACRMLERRFQLDRFGEQHVIFEMHMCVEIALERGDFLEHQGVRRTRVGRRLVTTRELTNRRQRVGDHFMLDFHHADRVLDRAEHVGRRGTAGANRIRSEERRVEE